MGFAHAAEFFVAPGGSDANPGTQAKPFASLEAARSGEWGAGFAVVARERRALAEQSREDGRKVRELLGLPV